MVARWLLKCLAQRLSTPLWGSFLLAFGFEPWLPPAACTCWNWMELAISGHLPLAFSEASHFWLFQVLGEATGLHWLLVARWFWLLLEIYAFQVIVMNPKSDLQFSTFCELDVWYQTSTVSEQIFQKFAWETCQLQPIATLSILLWLSLEISLSVLCQDGQFEVRLDKRSRMPKIMDEELISPLLCACIEEESATSMQCPCNPGYIWVSVTMSWGSSTWFHWGSGSYGFSLEYDFKVGMGWYGMQLGTLKNASQWRAIMPNVLLSKTEIWG